MPYSPARGPYRSWILQKLRPAHLMEDRSSSHHLQDLFAQIRKRTLLQMQERRTNSSACLKKEKPYLLLRTVMELKSLRMFRSILLLIQRTRERFRAWLPVNNKIQDRVYHL